MKEKKILNVFINIYELSYFSFFINFSVNSNARNGYAIIIRALVDYETNRTYFIGDKMPLMPTVVY